MNPNATPTNWPEPTPWPNGYDEHGQLWIVSIGINRSGVDAGEIDYCINTRAVELMRKSGRLNELLSTIDALKDSCTIKAAVEQNTK